MVLPNGCGTYMKTHTAHPKNGMKRCVGKQALRSKPKANNGKRLLLDGLGNPQPFSFVIDSNY